MSINTSRSVTDADAPAVPPSSPSLQSSAVRPPRPLNESELATVRLAMKIVCGAAAQFSKANLLLASHDLGVRIQADPSLGLAYAQLSRLMERHKHAALDYGVRSLTDFGDGQ